MERKLISKWHNQQVGDQIEQEWLYLNEDGTYTLETYRANMDRRVSAYGTGNGFGAETMAEAPAGEHPYSCF